MFIKVNVGIGRPYTLVNINNVSGVHVQTSVENNNEEVYRVSIWLTSGDNNTGDIIKSRPFKSEIQAAEYMVDLFFNYDELNTNGLKGD